MNKRIAPRPDNLEHFIAAASGKRAADLVLTNVNVVNLFSGEIIKTNVAVSQGFILGFGPYDGRKEMDLANRYLIPGLIDSHVHIESSLLSPEEFAKIVIPRGTTTVIADPHEIANVCGTQGIEYMIKAAESVPLDVFFMLPSCVPATSFESSGAVLERDDLQPLMKYDQVLGLAEMMNYPGVIQGDPAVLAKLSLAHGNALPIDGHSPMLQGRDLIAYAAAGIGTDHECTTIDEMMQRFRLGMYVQLREGSAAKNLTDLLKGITPDNYQRCLFCTDDKQPEDILKDGHIDYHLRTAVSEGIPPLHALRMSSLNTAQCYGLQRRGAIAPGYLADLAVVDDLDTFAVRMVFKEGEIVAENHKACFSVNAVVEPAVRDTVNIQPFKENEEPLKLSLQSDVVNVIHLHPGSISTEKEVRKVFSDREGCFEYHPKLDVVKLCVVERHKKTGRIGLGLIDNYGLIRGAVATTIAHDSHNIICAGTNDRDMTAAIESLTSCGGGMVLAADGSPVEMLELPIGGIMSDRSADEIINQLARMRRRAHDEFGIHRGLEPFMTLAFLALPVIPQLRLTDRGLFDVEQFNFISLEA